MYAHYVGNFDKATETLSLWTKKLPTMAALIDEIQVRYSTQDKYRSDLVPMLKIELCNHIVWSLTVFFLSFFFFSRKPRSVNI